MNPSTIRDSIKHCAYRYDQNEDGSPAKIATFLATWSTWEALRIRFIRVAIHNQGWLIKDADLVLANARISSMSRAAEFIKRLDITHPGEWPGESGATWKALSLIEPIRHKLTHGFRSTDPQKIRLATAITLKALQDRRWIESVLVPIESSGKSLIKIGSILHPRASSKASHTKDVAELFKLLEVNPATKAVRSPSTKDLEKLLLKLGQLELKTKECYLGASKARLLRSHCHHR